MKKLYLLMNKDIPLGVVEANKYGVEFKIVGENFPSIIKNRDDWLNNRSFYVDRPNINLMAKIARVDSNRDFLDKINAISITDTFWFKGFDSHILWDDISPYKNKLNLIASKFALEGLCENHIKDLNTPSPQYTIGGTAEKCIKRVNGKIKLYKTDGIKQLDNECNRQYSEYYASLVGDMLGIKNKVNYTIKINNTDNNGTKAYSICDIFTSEKESLLEFEYTGIVGVEKVLSNLNKRDKEKIAEMLILDSIILNYDRHYSNFGLIYNSDSFKIKGVAPIYDNDCSLFALTFIGDKTFDELYNLELNCKTPRFGGEHFNIIAKRFMTDNIYRKLLNLSGKIQLPKLKGLSDKRYEYINKLVNRRINDIIHLLG